MSKTNETPKTSMTQDPDKAYAAWRAVQEERAKRSAGFNWADAVDEPIDAKNIKLELGPLMTEEQMRAYCEASGIRAPKVVKFDKK